MQEDIQVTLNSFYIFNPLLGQKEGEVSSKFYCRIRIFPYNYQTFFIIMFVGRKKDPVLLPRQNKSNDTSKKCWAQ